MRIRAACTVAFLVLSAALLSSQDATQRWLRTRIAPEKPFVLSPQQAAIGVPTPVTLSWDGEGADRYDVYFGASSSPPRIAQNVLTKTFAAPANTASTKYYWRVIARNSAGQSASDMWNYTTASVAAPPPPLPPPSGTCSGIAVGLDADVQAALNAGATGTTFCLSSGTYRITTTLVPKSGQRLQGTGLSIISGARLLTSWTQSGSVWFAAGQTQDYGAHGECRSDRPRCSRSEELFVNYARVRHVDSLSAVTSTTWFFDYATDRIYIGTNPIGQVIETSVTQTAVGGTASNVTLDTLIVEKFANPAQSGAVDAGSASGWTISNSVVQLVHGMGMRTGNGSRITNTKFLHNGQLGIGGGGSNVLVDSGSEVAFNNEAGFNNGWEAGGTKFVATNGLIVNASNFHHNEGPGIWLDIDNINFTITNNTAEDNFTVAQASSPGIFIEISYGGKVLNNIVRRNGAGFNPWLWGAGILIAASGGSGLEVAGNIVENNEHGIALIQQPRGSGAFGPYLVQNVNVHDNTIRMSKGLTGAVQDAGDNSIYTSRNNHFVHNTYVLALGNRFAWNNGERSTAEWQALGNDATGIFTALP